MESIKHRRKMIALIDLKSIEMVLEDAIFALEPDEYTQLAIFTDAMPKIYLMRCRGLSFRQITRELNSGGMSVTYATVRTYYYRLYPTMAKECERYAKKQISVTPATRAAEQSGLMQTAAAIVQAPCKRSPPEASAIIAPSFGAGCVRRATAQ